MCGSVGPCSIRSCLSWRTLVASLHQARVPRSPAFWRIEATGSASSAAPAFGSPVKRAPEPIPSLSCARPAVVGALGEGCSDRAGPLPWDGLRALGLHAPQTGALGDRCTGAADRGLVHVPQGPCSTTTRFGCVCHSAIGVRLSRHTGPAPLPGGSISHRIRRRWVTALRSCRGCSSAGRRTRGTQRGTPLQTRVESGHGTTGGGCGGPLADRSRHAAFCGDLHCAGLFLRGKKRKFTGLPPHCTPCDTVWLVPWTSLPQDTGTV